MPTPVRPPVAIMLSIMTIVVFGPASPGVSGATYLLITSNELKSAFQPLVDRRIAQGYVCVIKSVQEIEAAYPGSDSQEKIRNCVKELLSPQEECYLCLGGDDSAVPVRYCLEDPVPTDLYYACLLYTSPSPRD